MKRISAWRYSLNERLRILKLLEEGKINAEEAARLLEALNYGESKKKSRYWGFFDFFPNFIHESFKDFDYEEKSKFGKKEKIELRGVSGDIELIGTDDEMIKIQKRGLARISEEDGILKIRAVSGTIIIWTPPKIDIELKSVSGNLTMENIEGRVTFHSVAGRVKGKNLSGSLYCKVAGGDIELDYRRIEELNINSGGDVILHLPEETTAEIEITAGGEILCEFELKEEINERQYLKGIINSPKAKVKINAGGDVSLIKRTSGD
ncbi:MAG: DUF4097 family beta strand repeat-containing protein [candidate division WOR-3 bacterium]